MLPDSHVPGLYGITPQNSTRYEDALWGKSQFNSTFPLALCIYMRDKSIAPVSVRMVDGKTLTDVAAWQMYEIVGSRKDATFYEFEKAFFPYTKLTRNQSDNIDLIVSINGGQRIPLEVKLTVVPDSATSKRGEEFWAPEMVIRPVSSAYAMMGLASRLMDDDNAQVKAQVIDALRIAFNKVSDWNNATEVIKHRVLICEALGEVLRLSENLQRPFLLQPIWKTIGQSLKFCEQCFDVFIWSDVAVLGIPLNEQTQSKTMTRTFREVARHVRSLYDTLQTGDYDYLGIYKGMSYGMQTDKAFTINGSKSIRYLDHDRLRMPAIPKTALADIILNGGQAELKPERRFDAAVQANMKIQEGKP